MPSNLQWHVMLPKNCLKYWTKPEHEAPEMASKQKADSLRLHGLNKKGLKTKIMQDSAGPLQLTHALSDNRCC